MNKFHKNWKRIIRWRKSKIKQKYFFIKHFKCEINKLSLIFSTEDHYSNQWFFPRYYGGRIHERQVSELLLNTLKEDCCFVDIGTNLGWYTCLAGKKLINGTVYGFEMDELNYELVRKNLLLNSCDKAKIFHAAISDHSGEIRYSRQSNTPSPSFRLASGNEITGLNKSKMIKVPAYSLDDFFEDKITKPDVIKIDVEGAELQVILGMKNILNSSKPLLFLEIHPQKLTHYNYTVQDLTTQLLNHNYQIFEIPQMRSHKAHLKLKKINFDTPILHNSMLFIAPLGYNIK